VVERAVLTRNGAPESGLHVVDGSGLASTDRVEPLTLATLLARTAAQPIGNVFVDDLPRVGIEGTVRYRQLTDALGRARAKSGHIADVNALAGYVQTRRHGRVAFAIIVNDRRADDGPVDDGIDRALDILARSEGMGRGVAAPSPARSCTRKARLREMPSSWFMQGPC
jgi:D-alanyl-D-alanine carboxypeptidase